MDIKNLTPQEREALEYITEINGQGVTWQDIVSHFGWKHNHADTILLKLEKRGLLDRRHVRAGRHSHYLYWPADGKEA